MRKHLFKLVYSTFIAIFLWPIYFLSGLIPRNPKKMALGTHTDSYSGNVKAIFQRKEFFPSYRKIFIYKSRIVKDKIEKENPKGEAYYYLSFKGIYHTITSKCHIYSSYPSDINFWLSRGSTRFNVWHGTPLKKIERDVTTGFYALKNKYEKILKYIYPHLYVKPDRLLVSSPYEEECFKSAFAVDEDSFIRAYPPRLQFLKRKNEQTEEKIILYAPTWRDDGSFALKDYLDLDEFNTFLLSHDMTMIVKPHPSDKSKHIDKEYSNIILADKNEDVYDILVKCNILITDYSSMMFEAMYLKIKTLLFCPDYKQYITKNRGFYQDMSAWSFTISFNENQLIEELQKKVDIFHTDSQYMPYNALIQEVLKC